MWYRGGFLVALLVAALASMSCSEDDIIAAAAGDPVPAGMGVTASTTAVGVINGVAGVLSDAAVASKPSLKAANAVIGTFPEDPTIDCDTGSMTITGSAPPDTTLGVTWAACQDGPYTITGGATLTIPSVRPCTEDGSDHDVPSSMTATVNAGTTVDVDGQVVTLSNVGVVVTNPKYDGAPDRAEIGGECGIVAADVVATGQISVPFQGQTTIIDLGSSSLNAHLEGTDTQVTATIFGDIAVDTICTDGAFPLTITTSVPLVFPDGGDGSPTSGTLIVNGEMVDVVTTSPIPCSGFL